MFIVKENERVVYGPAHYNYQMFKWVLVNDLELDPTSFTLPNNMEDLETATITPTVSILPVNIVYNPIDSDIEQPAGPFWAFTDTLASAIYNAEPKPIDTVKNELKAIVASQRYTKEISGIEINGSKILTDRESQAQLNGAYVSLKNNLVTSIDWKTSNGDWVALTLAEIEPMAIAVSTHVQSCFTEEKNKCVEIDLATTLAELKVIAESLKPAKEVA